VKVPKHYMEISRKAGMTKAEAVKAWKDSYGSEQ
jgi:hypothetical protein